VSYVPDGYFDQKLDLYLPTSGDGPFPTLFMIHEGNGRKEQLAFWARSFAEKGYAAISINHRQWPDYNYPAANQDAFCALAWVHANASTYGFDPDRIFALGHSAGGSLVAMLGVVDDPGLYLEGCPYPLPDSDWIHGVIAFTGIFDYAGAVERSANLGDYANDLLGGSLEEKPETWAEASAITWIDGSEPPFLLVHGGSDSTISPNNSSDFAEALEAAGVQVELLIVPDANHAQITKSEESLEAVAAFLARLIE
jgi:acetyl esterase/lipase